MFLLAYLYYMKLGIIGQLATIKLGCHANVNRILSLAKLCITRRVP